MVAGGSGTWTFRGLVEDSSRPVVRRSTRPGDSSTLTTPAPESSASRSLRYRVDESTRVVYVLDIDHSRDAYRS